MAHSMGINSNLDLPLAQNKSYSGNEISKSEKEEGNKSNINNVDKKVSDSASASPGKEGRTGGVRLVLTKRAKLHNSNN